jgi:ABC-type multidrug transport system ATPase subunit
MDAVIRTEALTKRYGPVLAVDAIDLDVRAGDVYGFLGANGSGKTTTVRVLSGRANLELFDAMGAPRRGRRARVGAVLERVGLTVAGDRKVKGYSLGMRQRLGLAAALLRSPRLLVLDEPTNGLDPQGIREMRELLLELNAAGATIFLSSHLLAEVEQMCTRVGVLDRGRLVVQDDLRNLQRPTGRAVVHTPDPEAARALLDGRIEHRDGDRLVVRAEDTAALNRLLVDGGVRVREIGPERRGLEQVVLDATTDPGQVGVS